MKSNSLVTEFVQRGKKLGATVVKEKKSPVGRNREQSPAEKERRQRERDKTEKREVKWQTGLSKLQGEQKAVCLDKKFCLNQITLKYIFLKIQTWNVVITNNLQARLCFC